MVDRTGPVSAAGFRIAASWVFPTCAALSILGCGQRPHTLGQARSSDLEALEVKSRIRSPAFSVSGVVGADDCGALIAGRAWGSVVRVGPDGDTDASMQSAPLGNASVMLEGDGRAVAAWATSHPPSVAWVEPDLAARRLRIPPHPWGREKPGPLVPLPDGRIAMARLSGRRAPLRRPGTGRPVPLVEVFDTSGVLEAELGRVADAGGLFDPWYEARGVIGYAGSIVFVRLSRGVVHFWDLESGDERTIELRTHFPLPRLEYDTLSFPWLTYGGERNLVSFAGQVETAAITSERIYVLANYAYEQVPIDSEQFELSRIWTPTDQGLDIYDHSGRLLGQYRIPSGSPNWIRADDHGRIFLGYTTALEVALDPTIEEPRCLGWPRELSIEAKDEPPSEDP